MAAGACQLGLVEADGGFHQCALSRASPTPPMDASMPAAMRWVVNRNDVYWADSSARRNTLIKGCADGKSTGLGDCDDGPTGDAVTRATGVNPRDVQRLFWPRIAEGLSSKEAALASGVSQPVGGRWFRQGGGMSSLCLKPPSGRYLSFAEREEIAQLKAQGKGVRETPDSPGATRRRSRGSCAVTPPPVGVGWSIGPRSRSGMPSGAAAVRRSSNSPRISGFATTSSTGSRCRCAPTRWMTLLAVAGQDVDDARRVTGSRCRGGRRRRPAGHGRWLRGVPVTSRRVL